MAEIDLTYVVAAIGAAFGVVSMLSVLDLQRRVKTLEDDDGAR